MKFFLLVLLALSILLTVYALLIRPWLRKRGLAPRWFEAVDRIELALFKKSETILFARLKVAVGILLSLLTDLSGMDLAPVLTFVPPEHMGTARNSSSKACRCSSRCSAGRMNGCGTTLRSPSTWSPCR
jgi:hypothetical protein